VGDKWLKNLKSDLKNLKNFHRVTGDYYLQTNGAIPFSKGEEGMKFHPED
jgi:hypothetical protein